MTDSPDFDWYDDAEDVVVPEQAAIAVCLNPKGDLVIRQAGQYHPDEDAWIVVSPDRAPAVADAILRLLALPSTSPTTASRHLPRIPRPPSANDVAAMPLLLERSGGESGGA